jgi:hypothetical protein
MLREGRPIGTITLGKRERGSFIENTRLFEAEQARTRELTEALAHQTATTEILNVISRSPAQVTPVFEAIVARAAELCGARATPRVISSGLTITAHGKNVAADPSRIRGLFAQVDR